MAMYEPGTLSFTCPLERFVSAHALTLSSSNYRSDDVGRYKSEEEPWKAPAKPHCRATQSDSNDKQHRLQWSAIEDQDRDQANRREAGQKSDKPLNRGNPAVE
jgi:hypothetical protein